MMQKKADIIYVPPQTPTTACRIAFIGEAPSVEELEKGQPFVGPAGRIFNAMLRTAELERSDPSFFIGNVFSQKIPDNDLKRWIGTKEESKEWEPFPSIAGVGVLKPEYRWHLARLAGELERYRPNLIVPLGGTALWAFTQKTDVGIYRGALMQADYTLPGAKILPTFHPSFVMKQWKFFNVVVGDFIKAAKHSHTPELIRPEKYLTIEPSLPELTQFAKLCLNADLLSVDIETGWGQITCIGFAPNEREAICVPFVDLRKPNKSYWRTPEEEVRAWEVCKEILESPVPKLGQNFAFYDAYWLLQKAGIRVMNFREDTRLLHHVLYPELPKSLGFMAGSYTDQGPWKHLGAGYSKYKEKKRDD